MSVSGKALSYLPDFPWRHSARGAFLSSKILLSFSVERGELKSVLCHVLVSFSWHHRLPSPSSPVREPASVLLIFNLGFSFSCLSRNNVCSLPRLVSPGFRVNLGHLARKVLLIFQDECVRQYQDVLALHGSRMRYQHTGFGAPGPPQSRGTPGGRGELPVTLQQQRGLQASEKLCVPVSKPSVYPLFILYQALLRLKPALSNTNLQLPLMQLDSLLGGYFIRTKFLLRQRDLPVRRDFMLSGVRGIM